MCLATKGELIPGKLPTATEYSLAANLSIALVSTPRLIAKSLFSLSTAALQAAIALPGTALFPAIKTSGLIVSKASRNISKLGSCFSFGCCLIAIPGI